uniref:Uncharacterized protein n=1 Tax=Panstrongylus lignarius TaxID=156445 RepID=A0A224Y0P0_9HEMI
MIFFPPLKSLLSIAWILLLKSSAIFFSSASCAFLFSISCNNSCRSFSGISVSLFKRDFSCLLRLSSSSVIRSSWVCSSLEMSPTPSFFFFLFLEMILPEFAAFSSNDFNLAISS